MYYQPTLWIRLFFSCSEAYLVIEGQYLVHKCFFAKYWKVWFICGGFTEHN